MTTETTIVIPAYNEVHRIESTLAAWTGCAASYPGGVGILVVVDGSTDATAAVVQRFADLQPCVQVLSLPMHRGKGAAIRVGMRAAGGRYVCYSDADLPVDPSILRGCITVLDQRSAEIVIGVRTPSLNSTHVPIERIVVSVLFRWLVRTLVLPTITDSQCGFKVLDRAAITPLLGAMVVDGFAFDVELIQVAVDAGLRVVEVPVQVTHRPGSTVRLWRDGWIVLRDIVRIVTRRLARRLRPRAR